jgi:hypothetical protein
VTNVRPCPPQGAEQGWLMPDFNDLGHNDAGLRGTVPVSYTAWTFLDHVTRVVWPRELTIGFAEHGGLFPPDLLIFQAQPDGNGD